MKVGGSKKKKGVSAVVATILIVMITVLAIGIIWVTILPMIRENLAVSDVCENAGVSIVSSQGYTCYKPSNITMVQVSKGNSDVNVTGLKFSVSMDGNSYDYDNQKVAYSTADYNVYYLNTSEFEKIEKISVVPTIKLGDSDKSCSAIFLDNVPLCSSNINLVEASAGRLIGRSSGYSTNAPVVPGCVVNCSNASNVALGQNFSDGCSGMTCVGTKQLGVGSVEDPYQITSWTDLNNTRNNLSASYELMNNLSSSDSDYDGIGNNWNPIGDSTVGFSGNLDGRGNIISDLKINRPINDYVGLFGSTMGDISNIGLININVTGSSYVGGLVGSSSGIISNSYSTGNVTGFSRTGGLVGYQNSKLITNSSSAANVIGTGTGNIWVGGLVGWQYLGTISNSYATGNVLGYGSNVGGLVGICQTNILLTSSYATGNVIGVGQVGGLAGNVAGVISNSYATGNVSGTGPYVGGLVAFKNSGPISNSYSTGNVTGSSYVGGLVGYHNGATITNSYWDTQTSGKTVMCGNGDGSNGCITANGKTTEEMKKILTYSGWDTNIWNLTNGKYPKLKWQN
jgi:FlaG/FlaF family flagellin (archaellin)